MEFGGKSTRDEELVQKNILCGVPLESVVY